MISTIVGPSLRCAIAFIDTCRSLPVDLSFALFTHLSTTAYSTCHLTSSTQQHFATRPSTAHNRRAESCRTLLSHAHLAVTGKKYDPVSTQKILTSIGTPVHRGNLSDAVELIRVRMGASKAIFDLEVFLPRIMELFQTPTVKPEAHFTLARPEPIKHSGGKLSSTIASPRCLTTFHSCCKTAGKVPCANNATCEAGDLTSAFLGSAQLIEDYVGTKEGDSKSSNGAIIGGAIGGGLGAAIIIGVLIFFFCRRRKRNQKLAEPETGANASTPMMKDGFQDNTNRLSTQFGQSRKSTSHSSYLIVIDIT